MGTRVSGFGGDSGELSWDLCCYESVRWHDSAIDEDFDIALCLPGHVQGRQGRMVSLAMWLPDLSEWSEYTYGVQVCT